MMCYRIILLPLFLTQFVLFEVVTPEDATESHPDVDEANEICQLETMEGRCRWNSEVIVMTLARWGRMKTGRCLNIHPKLMAQNDRDPMFLGCSEDVLALMDMKCSLQPACRVAVPDPELDRITPCYDDLTRYLEVSYTCVKVVQESRSCVVSVTTDAQFISSSSSTSSDVNSGSSSCGSKSHPWRLEAAAGQRINVSLLDFTAMSMSAAAVARNRGHEGQSAPSCRQYGYVLDKSNKKNVSVCGGGGAQLRQSHVYLSHCNNVEMIHATATTRERKFLLKVEAVGCTNMIPPENAWLRRSDNDIIIGCYSSQQTWQLTCDGREWKGLVGTCPQLYAGTLDPVERVNMDVENKLPVLMVMVIIAAAALVICVTVVCVGCLCLRHYKYDAMKKANLSYGGGATNVYPSNSRCARNNDKPVDNIVFTDRLPVSSEPQNHHWQLQQQMLMQAEAEYRPAA